MSQSLNRLLTYRYKTRVPLGGGLDEYLLRVREEGQPRLRICFDPDHEIPLLQKWFNLNNHPSRTQVTYKIFFIIVEHILFRRPEQLCVVLQVEQYTRLLNSAGCRAGRPKLDPHNIVYWFKNTRAALRRAETRLGGEAARSAWGFMV